jgi:hypothetical protein
LREAVAIRKQAYVNDHPRIAHATSLLGESLAAQGRHAEAEPLLVEGYEGLTAQRGAGHEQTQEARRRLADLYEAWGKPERAAAYRTEEP